MGADFIALWSRTHCLEFLKTSSDFFDPHLQKLLRKHSWSIYKWQSVVHSEKKHQFWGHQKNFQRKHMDIRKLCYLLIMNKSSASVPWEIRLAQGCIFKENWWNIKAQSIWDQLDNPISLSLHELWQTPNVTKKLNHSNCLWILPTRENAASEKEHSWLSNWNLTVLFKNEQK